MPISIIVCGASTGVGAEAARAMKPEISVSEFVDSITVARTKIQQVLSHPTTDVQAVILGGAFVPYLDELRETVRAKAGKQVTWLKFDASVSSTKRSGSYGQWVGTRAKDKLLELEKSGRLGEANDEAIPY